MDAVSDFEDLLRFFRKHEVRFLVIGGLAFIYHARPRYTKDMDLWVDPSPDNVRRANTALAAFGSPHLLSIDQPEEILQIGLPPNRIDLLRTVEGPTFARAWKSRIGGKYGRTDVDWIDLECLIDIKSRIDDPRHQRDVRDLKKVRDLKNSLAKRKTPAGRPHSRTKARSPR
ncbi:MAG: hypothetical protein WCP29_16520 [Acidobacteriota bacterium]